MPNPRIDVLSDFALLQKLSEDPSPEERLAIYEELYMRHHNYVAITIEYTFPLDELVEVGDVLNDVFLEFFETLDARKIIIQVSHPSKTSAYLRGILLNIIRNKRRAAFRRTRGFLKEIRLDEEHWKLLKTKREPETNMEQEADGISSEEAISFIWDTLNKCLSKRDQKYKKILELRLEKEPPPSYKEIAQELGITEVSARQRYKRALHKARAALLKEAEDAIGKGFRDDAMLELIIRLLKD